MTLVGCNKDSPSNYADKVYKSMMSKDYDAFLDLMPWADSISPEERHSTIEMMQMFDGLSGGIKGYKIVSEEISKDGQTAVVHVSVDYACGDSEEEILKLTKTSKGWQMFTDEYFSGAEYDEEGISAFYDESVYEDSDYDDEIDGSLLELNNSAE